MYVFFSPMSKKVQQFKIHIRSSPFNFEVYRWKASTLLLNISISNYLKPPVQCAYHLSLYFVDIVNKCTIFFDCVHQTAALPLQSHQVRVLLATIYTDSVQGCAVSSRVSRSAKPLSF